MKERVNIGCGRSPTDGWKNFDNTQAIKLSSSPFKLWILKTFGLLDKAQLENINWNKTNKILFADATKRIPLSDSSAECVYSSHMLEHLSREGALHFLKEALRILDNGGILRIAVPDLQYYVTNYIEDADANNFMSRLYVSAPPINTFKQRLRLVFIGYRHHQWMYDGKSLSNLLREVGFKETFVHDAGKTCIKDPGGLDLYERDDESVYVEAIK